MMRLSRSVSDILHFDLEIELTLRALRREQRQKKFESAKFGHYDGTGKMNFGRLCYARYNG